MAAKRKYPWEQWFAEECVTLLHGRDYHCSQSTMKQIVINNALRYGVYVRVTDLRTMIMIELLGDRDEVLHTDQATVAQ